MGLFHVLLQAYNSEPAQRIAILKFASMSGRVTKARGKAWDPKVSRSFHWAKFSSVTQAWKNAVKASGFAGKGA